MRGRAASKAYFGPLVGRTIPHRSKAIRAVA